MIICRTSYGGHHFSLLIHSEATAELLHNWPVALTFAHLPMLSAIARRNKSVSKEIWELVYFLQKHLPRGATVSFEVRL